MIPKDLLSLRWGLGSQVWWHKRLVPAHLGRRIVLSSRPAWFIVHNSQGYREKSYLQNPERWGLGVPHSLTQQTHTWWGRSLFVVSQQAQPCCLWWGWAVPYRGASGGESELALASPSRPRTGPISPLHRALVTRLKREGKIKNRNP